jgi:glycosyltransferase involved in cell wall biosynthesis
MIYGLAWASAIQRAYGVPFVVTEHSSEFSLGNVRQPLMAYFSEALSSSSQAMGVSRELCSTLERRLPLPQERHWTPMPNLVSARFTQAPPAAVVAEERNPDAPIRLLSVAALNRNKGHHFLLPALQQALHGGVNACLRIAGHGPEAAALARLAESLGIADRVQFLGHCSRDQVAAEMLACDALVLSSSYETFGVVVVEALMSGKPVLATKCGGPQDIIIEGRDGHLVDKDSPEALAQGIVRISREIASFDAQTIRSACFERYSETAFARSHAAMYAAVIASAGAAGKAR